jgi:hypothetical protein
MHSGLEGIPAESREYLADLFIVLSRGMTPQVAQAELDRFILNPPILFVPSCRGVRLMI